MDDTENLQANDIVNEMKQINKNKKKNIEIVVKLDSELSAKSMNVERLLECSREYCKIYGNLRIPDRYILRIEYSNGVLVDYRFGNVIRKIRLAHHGKGLARPLSAVNVKRMNKIDPDWLLSDIEYEREIFMRKCRDYFKQNGHLRIEDDYTTYIDLHNGLKEEYELGKKMYGVKARLRGNNYGIVLSKEMVEELNELDKDWAKSNYKFDVDLKNQMLLECAREFYAENGHLRVNQNVEVEFVDEDGQIIVYPFGKDIVACKSVINNNGCGRKLPKEILDEFFEMDSKWCLSEADYCRIKFMECARMYFEKNGHLRPTLRDKVLITYPNGGTENYNFGPLLRKLRYDLIHKEENIHITEQDVGILNKMDPYWINREKTIEEMNAERPLDDNLMQEIDEYYQNLNSSMETVVPYAYV